MRFARSTSPPSISCSRHKRGEWRAELFMDSPHALSYARPESAWPVRRILRWTLIVTLLLAAVAAAVALFKFPWLLYGSKEAYHRHQYLAFTFSPGTVVYEENPARAATLAARSTEYRSCLYFEGPTYPKDKLFAAYHSPPDSLEYTRETCPAVFMHERAAPARHPRWVLTMLDRINGGPNYYSRSTISLYGLS